MAKPDTSAYKTFDEITTRLDEIVVDVKNKETSLEHSLDLFDEAIALGSKAVDLVDTIDFTPDEEKQIEGTEDTPQEQSESSEDKQTEQKPE